MNKNEFLNDIRKRIKNLPKNEIDEALEYYSEYIEDSEKTEEETIRELGTPKVVASQILADYAVGNESNNRGFIKNIMLVILAIFAAPIGLPLAFAAIMLLFALVATLGGLFIAFMAVIFALFISGVAIFIAGIAAIIQVPQAACFYIGCSLILIGICMILCVNIKKVIPKVKCSVKKLIMSILSKFNKRDNIERRNSNDFQK